MLGARRAGRPARPSSRVAFTTSRLPTGPAVERPSGPARMTPMAEPRRWFDPSQPQTLQGAVMLCYITAALSLLWVLFGAYPLVISLGLGAAGYGVANESGGVTGSGSCCAGLTVLWCCCWPCLAGVTAIVLNLVFMVVLVVLFLHPQSREYQRIWFK